MLHRDRCPWGGSGREASRILHELRDSRRRRGPRPVHQWCERPPGRRREGAVVEVELDLTSLVTRHSRSPTGSRHPSTIPYRAGPRRPASCWPSRTGRPGRPGRRPGGGVALVLLLVLLVSCSAVGPWATRCRWSTALGASPRRCRAYRLASIASVSEHAVNVVTILGCVPHRRLQPAGAGPLPGRARGGLPSPRPGPGPGPGRHAERPARTVLVSGARSFHARRTPHPRGPGPDRHGGRRRRRRRSRDRCAGLTLAPALVAVVTLASRLAAPGRAGRPGPVADRSYLARSAGLAQARPWPFALAATGLLLLLGCPFADPRGGELGRPGATSRERAATGSGGARAGPCRAEHRTHHPARRPPPATPGRPRRTQRLSGLDDVADVTVLDPPPDGSSQVAIEPDGPTSGPAVERLVSEVYGRATSELPVLVGGPPAELR